MTNASLWSRASSAAAASTFAVTSFDQVGVDPDLLAFGREQVALDAAACGDRGFATDEAGLGVVCLDRAVEDSATDIVGIVAVVGGLHLTENAGLTVDVGDYGVPTRFFS